MNMTNIKAGSGRELGLLKELVVALPPRIDPLMYSKMRNTNTDRGKNLKRRRQKLEKQRAERALRVVIKTKNTFCMKVPLKGLERRRQP